MDKIQSVVYDFKTEQEILDFVISCEDRFFAQVDDVADKILKSGKKFIALSGPSCSGKTTASERICHAFLARGIRVKTISIDDFYIDRDTLLERAKASGKPIDFDSPTTINLSLLADCVHKLRLGEVAELPHYSFVEGKCTEYTPFCGKDADYFLFEGIQAIYPNVLEILGEEGVVSLAIRPSTSLQIGEEVFYSHELRFARRLVRDFRYRSAAPEYTFYLWEGVRANEELHIMPYEDRVDFRIDSTMAYEPFVIRDYVMHCLSLVPEDDPHREQAVNLMKEYEHIPSIPSKYVPDHSIFREFIGGKEESVY
ncbi:MAG: hypothetical protein IJD35_01155 [Clostridia bacterium]|nr:hypothetical protein [Clostridia bacterium]